MQKIKGPMFLANSSIPAPDGTKSRLIGGTLPVAANGARVEGLAMPLIKARIYLSGMTIPVTAANDYGSVKLVDFQNKNLLIFGHALNAKGTLTAPNVGTELTLALGSAAASSTTLPAQYMAAKTGVGAAQAFTAIGHTFDESSPALVFLDGHATNNDLFLNAGLAVASGTTTITFTDGYVDVFYHDLDEPVAL